MTTPHPAPLYNLSRLIKMSFGNMAFVKKMALLFMQQAPLDIKELQTAAAGSEIKQLKDVAHRMKPSVDNMGIISLTEIIREVELYDGHEINPRLLNKITIIRDTILNAVVQLEQDPLLKEA